MMMIGKAVDDMYISMLPEDVHPSDKEQPTFKAYLTIIVRDTNGNIVKVHKQWSHSPTSNFVSILLPYNWYVNTGQGSTIINTGGSSYTINPTAGGNANPLYYPTNDLNYPTYLAMIQVGSGSQSNPYSAYSLASPIANGSGSGQLQYGQPSVSSAPIVSGSSAYFYITQTFNNNSGSTVTITEIGILLNATIWVPSASNRENIGNVLVWYDVLSSSISIPNGGSLTIYYTFTVNP
jgi:hypothetical protein